MIDVTEVEQAIKDSLYKETEIALVETDEDGAPVDAVRVKGIVHDYGFHPRRLEEQREKVIGWLEQLPLTFRTTAEGGGCSFLNMPTLEDGTLWGEQPDAGNLMCLGIGLGLVKIQLPREMWSVLPGGVPYLEIKLGN